MMQKNEVVFSVDIGGTKINCALVENSGKILLKKRFATPLSGSEDLLNLIMGEGRSLMKSFQPEKIVGIGVSTGGFVDPFSGKITYATPLLPGWQGTEIKKILSEEFHLPVVVDNDGNMAAMGEWSFGGAKDSSSMVFIALGTGIGGGVILNGEPLRGFQGAGASLGHICLEKDGRICTCGLKGCFESYCSGRGLEGIYSEIIKEGQPNLSSLEIFQTAVKKEELSIKAIDVFIDYLAIGITTYYRVFDPEKLVLGGGISESLGDYLHKIKNLVSKRLPLFDSSSLILSSLGNDAPLLGAAASVFSSQLD